MFLSMRSKILFLLQKVASNSALYKNLDYFSSSSTAFFDLVDFNLMPENLGFNDLLNRARVTSGTLPFTEESELQPLLVAKIIRITGNSSNPVIHYAVYFPVKFDIQSCSKREETNDLPPFYIEMLSEKK